MPSTAVKSPKRLTRPSTSTAAPAPFVATTTGQATGRQIDPGHRTRTRAGSPCPCACPCVSSPAGPSGYSLPRIQAGTPAAAPRTSGVQRGSGGWIAASGGRSWPGRQKITQPSAPGILTGEARDRDADALHSLGAELRSGITADRADRYAPLLGCRLGQRPLVRRRLLPGEADRRAARLGCRFGEGRLRPGLRVRDTNAPATPPAVRAPAAASAAHTRPRPARQPRAPRRTCAFRRDFERSCPWSPLLGCGSGRGKTTPARSLRTSTRRAATLSANTGTIGHGESGPSPGQMPISSDPVTEGRKGRAPSCGVSSRRSHFRE